jgi:hypothetical protein
MTQPFWGDDGPEPWNVIVLGNFRLPGVAKVSGLKLSDKLDVKSKPGADGATITRQGYKPSTFEIQLTMTTAAERATWKQVVNEIRPRPGKTPPTPYTVVHPLLNDHQITKLYVEEIAPSFEDKQTFVVKLSCIEFVPKPKHSGVTTPKNAAAGATKNVYDAYLERRDTVWEDAYRQKNPGVSGPPPPPPPSLDPANSRP